MSQPFLHDSVITLDAPIQVWSDSTGQVDATTAPSARGIYCGDDRVVHGLVLHSPSHDLEATGVRRQGRGRTDFGYVLRTPERGSDPFVVVNRRRIVDGSGITEEVEVSASGERPERIALRLEIACEGSSIAEVKAGRPPRPASPAATTWSWRERCRARLSADGAVPTPVPGGFVIDWAGEVSRETPLAWTWRLTLADESAPFVGVSGDPLELDTSLLSTPLARMVEAGLADATSLLMAPRDRPDLAFLAAGSPWYLTLFGRDSLVAATLLQPWFPELAITTLEALAARQGTCLDSETGEQPGKILHEVRRDVAADVAVLPPVYYGTIDATCLWIRLLGLVDDPAAQSRLRPHLLAALDWLEFHADSDGDGFLEYIDESGHGLANQGWKDSEDSVRWADGTLARAPIALAEVQGYAHAAALTGARLLQEDLPARAAFWRDWAEALRARFRERFWVADERGPYVALALDSDKRAVDGVASNMGHLLGTGILSAQEGRIVVDRLMAPTMRSGYGIRTLDSGNGGYWPFGYHVGSVWTHDTAMIVDGMLADGFDEEAAILARELLRAAEGFGFRMPELYAGLAATEVFPPHPYPASCRPQAWAAASSVVVARALGELRTIGATDPGRAETHPTGRDQR